MDGSAPFGPGLFRAALESCADAVLVADSKGRVQFVNPAGLAMLHAGSSVEVEHRAWASLTPSAARPAVRAAVIEARNGSSASFEARLSPASGAETWWEAKVSPIRDADGGLCGLIAVMRDVSALKLVSAEAASQLPKVTATAAVLRSALRLAQLDAWRYDCLQNRVSFTPELRDNLGQSPEDQPLAEALKIWVEEDQARFKGSLADAVQSCGSVSFEGRIVTADGEVRWLRVLGEAEVVDSRCVALRGSSQDITDELAVVARLKTSEQAAHKAAEAKSEFLANMSHEIRTPMNGVMGMNALLLRTPLTSEQRTFARSVQLSAENLLVIINDILDVSKLEAGKLELEAVDFQLENLVEDAVELMSPRAVEKSLELACSLDRGARAALRGDPVRLRQIILNLLSNALKFTETGHVSIVVTSQAEVADAVTLRFEVADTGIGLSDDAKSRLFQKFEQADTSITRRFGGTGLGLSICQQLVALMAGRIGMTDRPGGGSIFWFEVALPAGRPTQIPTRTADAASLAGVRVLVVDDIEINRRIYRTELELEGMDVAEAASGDECLAAMKAAEAAGRPYEIVLLDQMMPKLTGVEVASQIRAHPGQRQPMLVLNSSMGMPLPEGANTEAGIDAVLMKPVRRQDLVNCLARLWGGGAELSEPNDQEAPPSGAETCNARVLLAEDNLVNTMLAVTVLEAIGCRVDCVVNGVEAVAAMRAGTYDLILMDVHMPEMDGLEATRRVREIPGPAGATPIVAMTANAANSDREACLAAGMNDFISKPLNIDHLAETVVRWVAEGGDAAPISRCEASIMERSA